MQPCLRLAGGRYFQDYHKSVAVFRCGPDARAYVVGSSDENELILNMVLDGLVDALTALLGGTFDARTCFENLETAMLCVDLSLIHI